MDSPNISAKKLRILPKKPWIIVLYILLLSLSVLGTVAYTNYCEKTLETLYPENFLQYIRTQPVELLQDEPLTPELFVEFMPENQNIQVKFYTETPDTNTLGFTSVMLEFQDDFGRNHYLFSALRVRRQDPNPQILGVQDIEVFINDTIAYRSGVSVTDLYGEDLAVQIDNSQVDVKIEGVYPISYLAEDDYGNKSQVDALVYVDENTQLMVELLIEDIFAEILKPEMSDYDKAFAIFRWCRSNIRYASSGPKEDWYVIAYAGLRGQPGDCYTYFSISYLMLQQAGIQVVPLERVENPVSRHLWTAVNTGNGWYHFDPCPTWTKDEVFMYSEAQARDVSSRSNQIVGKELYYYSYLDAGITIEEN